MSDFETGQIVQLMSGGLPMTVAYVVDARASAATGKDMGVHCDWLDNEGRPHHAAFQKSQLMRRPGIERAASSQT